MSIAQLYGYILGGMFTDISMYLETNFVLNWLYAASTWEIITSAPISDVPTIFMVNLRESLLELWSWDNGAGTLA